MNNPWLDEYRKLSEISKKYPRGEWNDWDKEGFWSFGDAESNHIYYHPALTHYAHQAFESYFFKNRVIHYSDLSREGEDASTKRANAKIKDRMTFPVTALFQEMYVVMYAGENYKMKILCTKIDEFRVGVICLTYNDKHKLCASIMWLRWAKSLDDDEIIKIPGWFPINHLKQTSNEQQ